MFPVNGKVMAESCPTFFEENKTDEHSKKPDTKCWQLHHLLNVSFLRKTLAVNNALSLFCFFCFWPKAVSLSLFVVSVVRLMLLLLQFCLSVTLVIHA